MKKVLLLAENWEPRVGGIERYLTGIVANLRQSGFEVEVLTPHPPAFAKASAGRPPLSPLAERGVTRKRFFWPLVKPAWLPLFIHLWRRARRKEFEVLLCGKALFEGLLGYYLKKHLGIPYIVFTYAMEIEAWQQDDATWKKLGRVLRHADKIIYINEVTKKRLQELGVRDEQLLKVQPGIGPAPTPGESASPTLAGERARRYVLSVGRLVPRKGFDTLIEAFGELDQTKFQDVELWIAGEGPDKQRLRELAAREYLIRSATEPASPYQGEAPLLTKERPIEDRVRFLGQVSDQELQKLYAGAEIFALTPREIAGDIEGFGIVYLEAAAHGLPAVGTRTGGVLEAVTHDKTGLLVSPDDPKAVAIALMQLLANQELRDRLGRQAQLRVQEEFLWAKKITPLVSSLRQISV